MAQTAYKLRRDEWTAEEDTKLVSIILDYIRQGSTQLKAFEHASEVLKIRTASACGFRWNSELRQLHKEQFNAVRKQAIAERLQKGKTTAYHRHSPRVMLKSVKVELDRKAAEEAAKLKVETPKKKEVAKVVKPEAPKVDVSVASKPKEVSDTFYKSFVNTIKEHAVLEHKYAQLQKQNARLKKENEELKAAQK